MKVVKPGPDRDVPRGVVGGAEISQVTAGASNIYIGVFRVPRGASSRARYAHVATRLADSGYAVYAPDHRGHGRSEGPRARIVFADAAEDLDQLIVLIGERYPGIAVFLLGHSMGGAIALRYCLKHQDRLT